MNGNYLPDVANAVVSQEIKSFAFPATAATADLAEVQVGTVGPGASIALGSVQICTGGTLTANNSNYYTITINKRTAAAPGTAVPIATGTTQITGTGSWAAFTAVALPVVSGAFVSPGDVITIAAVHTASGVAIPASTVELFGKLN
ncbi:MAG TPA: hypothetical protein VK841_09440 [Polyangiaceae bacterium]|jgi:hypothetical protein|nr:hypothetical protein [Polyangiaceae bacterium]